MSAIIPLPALRDGLTRKHIAIAVTFLLLPFLVGTFLANQILVFAVFVLGFNLLLGYTGEISFGHAAFFGLGAYGTILAMHHVTPNAYAAMVVGVLTAAAAGAVIGAFSLRRRAIYFAMVTLAFAQMVYHVVFRWTGFTGGSNGIGVPQDATAAIGPFDPLGGGPGFYVFGLTVLGATWLGVRRVVRSPFGTVLIAIRENEERAMHLGFDTTNFLWGAFLMSTLLSGIGGALFALLFTFTAPGQLYWVTSGEVVMMALLGGIGTLGGPIVGAGAFIILHDTISSITNEWRVIFGLLIVFVVLYAPEGIWGTYLSSGDREHDAFDPRRILGWFR